MITVMRMLPEDIPAAARLEKSCFSDAWSEAGVRGTLENACGFCLSAKDEDGRLVGYLLAQIVCGEGELLRIAADPGCRRRGIGRCLLNRMLEETNVTIWRLDVRESNEAGIRLYETAGFRKIILNRNFYTDPKENGYLMVRELC